MIHFTNRRKLVYYDGNYDQFVKTKAEMEENQLKQYKWEQGTAMVLVNAKLVRLARSAYAHSSCSYRGSILLPQIKSNP